MSFVGALRRCIGTSSVPLARTASRTPLNAAYAALLFGAIAR